nr:MAG TPA: hypothetical protein [Caudoviricetes sp.]
MVFTMEKLYNLAFCLLVIWLWLDFFTRLTD